MSTIARLRNVDHRPVDIKPGRGENGEIDMRQQVYVGGVRYRRVYLSADKIRSRVLCPIMPKR